MMVDDSVDHSWKPSLRYQNMLQGHGCLAIGGAMGSPQPSSEMLVALVNLRETFRNFNEALAARLQRNSSFQLLSAVFQACHCYCQLSAV
jgi:hypothetical protein